jgi:hypothetical protein
MFRWEYPGYECVLEYKNSFTVLVGRWTGLSFLCYLFLNFCRREHLSIWRFVGSRFSTPSWRCCLRPILAPFYGRDSEHSIPWDLQVLLLTGFLFTILMRVLKNDFLRYARSDEEEQGKIWNDDILHWLTMTTSIDTAWKAIMSVESWLIALVSVTEAEESGWKLIHGDVFRYKCNSLKFLRLRRRLGGRGTVTTHFRASGVQISQQQGAFLCYSGERSSAAVYEHRSSLPGLPWRL